MFLARTHKYTRNLRDKDVILIPIQLPDGTYFISSNREYLVQLLKKDIAPELMQDVVIMQRKIPAGESQTIGLGLIYQAYRKEKLR